MHALLFLKAWDWRGAITLFRGAFIGHLEAQSACSIFRVGKPPGADFRGGEFGSVESPATDRRAPRCQTLPICAPINRRLRHREGRRRSLVVRTIEGPLYGEWSA